MTETTASNLRAADSAGPSHVRAFGLRILSDIDAEGLAAAEPGPVDLTIRRAAPAEIAETEVSLDFETGRHTLAWPGIGAFRIEGPDRIEVTPHPGIPDDMLALPLTGPVIAMALHARGLTVLHASAVEVGGAAVVLLGDKGAGKSTTAAALVAAGHRLLSDDLVVIAESDDGHLQVEPSFARMKLSEGASEALNLDDTSRRVLPTPDATEQKSMHRMDAAMASRAVSLGLIAVLHRGEAVDATALPGPEAVAQLLRFSYARRFGRAATAGPQGARHFAHCARIAEKVTPSRLTVPRGLDRLPDTVAFVEEALRSTGSDAE